MKRWLVVLMVVGFAFSAGALGALVEPGGPAPNAPTPFGPAPNSGDGIPDGSGFDPPPPFGSHG